MATLETQRLGPAGVRKDLRCARLLGVHFRVSTTRLFALSTNSASCSLQSKGHYVIYDHLCILGGDNLIHEKYIQSR